MAPPPEAGAGRAWRGLALSLTTLAHGAALGGTLLDGDRLLLTRHPALHSFAGLATLLAEGRVVLRGAGLTVRDHAPLGALATWLSWQWLRASPAAQHAVDVALLVSIAAALASLLRALRVPSPGAALAALALTLSPCAADLSAPLAARGPLLALALALVAARRAVDAAPATAVAWSAGASLAAGLCAPGYGLLGLVPAGLARPATARAPSMIAAVLATVAALSLTRGASPLLPSWDAARAGVTAALLAWLPSPAPFVAATGATVASAAALLPVLAAAFALARASRADDAVDASLLRAGAGALLAAALAAAVGGAAPVVDGSAALSLQLGVVLVLVGLARPRGAALAARARPWMLVLVAVPAAITAHRVRAWSDDAHALAALAARDPADPESSLARARLALRRGRLDEAAPWCVRYARAAPATGRADGCGGALTATQGDHAAAVRLLRRWARQLGDVRALRAATLELADATPDPRFGAAFREATGYALPRRRPGEPR